MVCLGTCAISTGFIFASLYTMMVSGNEHVNLAKVLDADTVKIYDNIKKERMQLYLHGLVIGLIVATLILYLNRDTMTNTTANVCTFVLIVAVVNYFYYNLMPKKDWLLNHLKTPEQNKQWLSVYKQMKYKWHMGFLIGLVGYGVLCYGFYKN